MSMCDGDINRYKMIEELPLDELELWIIINNQGQLRDRDEQEQNQNNNG